MFISFDSLHMNSTWGATNKIAKVNTAHRHLSLNLVKGFDVTCTSRWLLHCFPATLGEWGLKLHTRSQGGGGSRGSYEPSFENTIKVDVLLKM